MIRIAGDGGVEAVVAELGAHPADAQVQINGCTALGSLAASSNDYRTRIAGAGGVEAVVAAMRAHRDNGAVQDSGCTALGNLCAFNDANRRGIVAAGAVEAVVAALRAHRASAAVQTYGCYALGTLAESDPANQALIAGAGGVEAVDVALCAHPENAQVQRFGNFALCNLNAHIEAKDALPGEAEAVFAHRKKAEVQDASCSTLGTLVDSQTQTPEGAAATEKSETERLDPNPARTSGRVESSPKADDDFAYQVALGDDAYRSVKDAMESLRGEVIAGLRDIEDALGTVADDHGDETERLQNEVMAGVSSVEDALEPVSELASCRRRRTEPLCDVTNVRGVAAPPEDGGGDGAGAARATGRGARKPSRKTF